MQKIQLEKSLSEGFIFYAISTLTIAIQFLFYLIHSPRLAMMDVGGWMFYITAACSHAALWALIPYIISLIVAITVRRHQAAAITHIILVSLLNILAYIDGSVYSLYKFHINGFVLNLMVGEGTSEIFTFSFWLYLKFAGVLVCIFAANTLLRILAGHCYTRFHRCGFPPVLATLILFALFSNFYHAYAAVAQKTSVIRSAPCLPYYFPLTATRLMMKLGVVSSKDVIKMNFNNKKQSADLNYPIDSLKYEVHSNPKNVVLIAIDSWNYRAFNQDITPHISHFADSCSRFTSHLSSSNGTRGSIFGLFFSLSSIYWTDFEVSGIQPLLIEELLKQNYQIGIYPQCYNRQPAICQNTFLKGTRLAYPYRRKNRL